MGESKTTKKHQTIKSWAEKRGGKPSIVKGAGREGEGAGILRIDFPGYDEKSLKEISWQEFFDTFDKKDLTFLYQEKTDAGELSRFNKFINKDGRED